MKPPVIAVDLPGLRLPPVQLASPLYSALTVCTSFTSTSLKLSVPLSLRLPPPTATSSVTAPLASTVSTGASLVPVMLIVTTSVSLLLAPPSRRWTLTLKLSVMLLAVAQELQRRVADAVVPAVAVHREAAADRRHLPRLRLPPVQLASPL